MFLKLGSMESQIWWNIASGNIWTFDKAKHKLTEQTLYKGLSKISLLQNKTQMHSTTDQYERVPLKLANILTGLQIIFWYSKTLEKNGPYHMKINFTLNNLPRRNKPFHIQSEASKMMIKPLLIVKFSIILVYSCKNDMNQTGLHL